MSIFCDESFQIFHFKKSVWSFVFCVYFEKLGEDTIQHRIPCTCIVFLSEPLCRLRSTHILPFQLLVKCWKMQWCETKQGLYVQQSADRDSRIRSINFPEADMSDDDDATFFTFTFQDKSQLRLKNFLYQILLHFYFTSISITRRHRSDISTPPMIENGFRLSLSDRDMILSL